MQAAKEQAKQNGRPSAKRGVMCCCALYVQYFNIERQQQHSKRKYIKRSNVSPGRPHLQITK